jgi:hypothetical protein
VESECALASIKSGQAFDGICAMASAPAVKPPAA